MVTFKYVIYGIPIKGRRSVEYAGPERDAAVAAMLAVVQSREFNAVRAERWAGRKLDAYLDSYTHVGIDWKAVSL